MTKETKKTPVVEAAAGVASKEAINTVQETTLINPEQEFEQLRAENAILKEKAEALEKELDQVKELREHEKPLLDMNTELIKDNMTYMDQIETLNKAIDQKDATISELQEYKNAHLKAIDIQEENAFAESIISETPIVLEPFNYEGNLYTLTDDAPKTLAFNDHVYTQKELLNDKEAMISLIVGENAFIKQIV